MRQLKMLTAAIALGVGMALTAGTAEAAKFECESDSPTTDASMDAKLRTDDGRTKFGVSFEAAKDAGFGIGQMLDVKVGGTVLADQLEIVGIDAAGDITLDLALAVELGGDLNYDTTAGDPGDEDQIYPPKDDTAAGNDVNVSNNDIITVGSLPFCTLGTD